VVIFCNYDKKKLRNSTMKLKKEKNTLSIIFKYPAADDF
jgi:hypothetical protein